MNAEGNGRGRRLPNAKVLLPILGVLTFLTMMAIAEYQIRSSPQWPPPPRHEVGGWRIDDPPLWTFAGSLNLPATLPIVLMAAASDGFTYALDDHHLIYIPWTFFVSCLWYFVADQIELSYKVYSFGSTTRSVLTLVILGLLTVELIYCGAGILNQQSPVVLRVCFWAWAIATILGWVNLIEA